MKKRCDVLIIGGGIVGLSIARELQRRGVHSITVLEKESRLGVHASGRNSGVLHAGLYYASDTLKAKTCARGARLMREYATARHIRMQPTGKVIVSSGPEERESMEALFERAVKNGIRVERINAARLKELEPAAYAQDGALYSPDTATIDSMAVLESLRRDLLSDGFIVLLSEPLLAIDASARIARTTHDEWNYQHLLNASGLYADRWAHAMDVGLQYSLLPFRGGYHKLASPIADQIRGLIYPVPDPRLPFLGVHFTRTVDGDVLVGPTAEPALGRENYSGLSGLAWRELPTLLKHLSGMLIKNRNGLWTHVKSEMGKRMPGGFYRCARRLVPSLRPEDLIPGAKVGLRAQLLNLRTMQLVMDFVIESGPGSTHILNSVSPAFTASFAFAEMAADRILGQQDTHAF